MTDDQKRALGLGGIAVAGLLIFRRTQSKSGRQVSGPQTSGASGSVAPYTPQAPLPLMPGQSVYDPNSEALLNTPAALDNTGGPGNGSQTRAPGAPAYTVNVAYPKPVTNKKNAKKPTKRPVVKHPRTPAKKPTKKAARHG